MERQVDGTATVVHSAVGVLRTCSVTNGARRGTTPSKHQPPLRHANAVYQIALRVSPPVVHGYRSLHAKNPAHARPSQRHGSAPKSLWPTPQRQKMVREPRVCVCRCGMQPLTSPPVRPGRAAPGW